MNQTNNKPNINKFTNSNHRKRLRKLITFLSKDSDITEIWHDAELLNVAESKEIIGDDIDDNAISYLTYDGGYLYSVFSGEFGHESSDEIYDFVESIGLEIELKNSWIAALFIKE